MSFIPYVPDIEQWSRYFVNQAEKNLKNKKKIKEVNSSIDGSISSGSDIIMSVVGGKKIKKNSPLEVTVNMTSPAEVTADQAASELENINTSNEISQSRQGAAVKRKGSKSETKRKNKTHTKVRRYNDIFSK
jgi:hypothetical protein